MIFLIKIKRNILKYQIENIYCFFKFHWGLGIGDWGLGIGDWGKKKFVNYFILKN